MNDGGPAFPTADLSDIGMSLRDYFAAKAMQAEIITTFSDATPESAAEFRRVANSMGRPMLTHLAHNAYDIADAMLAVRDKHT